jgi:2-amino-4-hydroxy-6-hydroxymethyldihydropteridine diphosphokinase
VAIALGSNLGDRRGTLLAAVDALATVLSGLRVSSFYETDPVGVEPGQPRFLNAVVVGESVLTPRLLLDTLLAIERRFGRERPHPGAARTLDLDLILHGSSILEEPGLVVPHPRFRDRAFVLNPLADVAADWIDPVTGLTVRQLRDRI